VALVAGSCAGRGSASANFALTARADPKRRSQKPKKWRNVGSFRHCLRAVTTLETPPSDPLERFYTAFHVVLSYRAVDFIVYLGGD
jgi:hypothetical protein